MKILHTAAFLCTIGFALACSDVGRAFEKAKIKPDILKQTPKEPIVVRYGNELVKLGNELTPTQVKDVPDVYYKYEDDALYTLILTDPDAFPDQENREFMHWVVLNIPEVKVSKGETLAEFVGSATPEGTGLHRYTFLLYKQNQGVINFDEKPVNRTDGPGRLNFSSQKLTDKYNLGSPIAGNFYLAQYDDYVPTLVEQLGL